eukprot:scaffold5345_cov86-Cylindrotheca_fusiformis.AAC.2
MQCMEICIALHRSKDDNIATATKRCQILRITSFEVSRDCIASLQRRASDPRGDAERFWILFFVEVETSCRNTRHKKYAKSLGTISTIESLLTGHFSYGNVTFVDTSLI